MSFLGKLVLFSLLIGLFQKGGEVLLVALALAWIYGAMVRPAETFTLLFLLTLAACIRAYPFWSLMLIAIIAAGLILQHNE
tara:strand:+ start:3344 stop:3586 length:243 start_codon:yes stop_codon:yes gene_type:complete